MGAENEVWLLVMEKAKDWLGGDNLSLAGWETKAREDCWENMRTLVELYKVN